MKIAFAGKGGVGKTTLTAWTARYLAAQGHDVWLVDADTALSLGQACGLDPRALPEALVRRETLIRERIGSGIINLNPEVADLPAALSVPVPMPGTRHGGTVRLLVMGTVTNAGGGCACEANALLKALLAHLVLDTDEWVLVDLEAGVEHLGRGTVAAVDALVVVSEPSRRGLDTAREVSRMAADLGLANQALVLNRHAGDVPPLGPGLPERVVPIPPLAGLAARQLTDASVLGLPEADAVDGYVGRLVDMLASGA
ncbi:MAG: ArsA-related P-loop ATPase [Desulfovibrionaceae bacterium]